MRKKSTFHALIKTNQKAPSRHKQKKHKVLACTNYFYGLLISSGTRDFLLCSFNFFFIETLMIKLLINRRLTLSYSLLIPIVYNGIRKGSISEELVLLLVQNCKLPCLLFGYLLQKSLPPLSP